MSDTQDHTSPEQEAHDQVADKQAPDWPSPGQKLKIIREDMGLSQNRVADALHLTVHYVKALEDDQYDKLPGKTFVKGYFRAYGKLLGTNVDDLMLCYERYVAALEENDESEAKVIRAKKTYDQNIRWMVCAALIIVVVIGVSWWLAQRSGAADTAMAGSAGTTIAEITATEEAVTAEALIATLEETRSAAGSSAEAAAGKGDIADFGGSSSDVADAGESVGDAPLEEVVQASSGESLLSAVAAAGVPAGTASPTDDAAIDVASNGDGVTGPAMTDLSVIVDPAEKDMPEYSVIEIADSRQVQLEGEGNDLLEVHFNGASWIEVDNRENTRLYHNMLDIGDDLTIRGKAPFNILVGDANVVNMTFNSRAVDVTSRKRTDNSARIILEPEAR